MPRELSFYTSMKSKADKTMKLIKNSLSKNISDAITAIDVRLPNHPIASTNTSKSQHVFHCHS